ncbi:MAG: alkaline phosphatase D [Verrucomicrobiales bacterium]|jgi:alkaline phosphatase D
MRKAAFFIAYLATCVAALGDVQITDLEDRIRIEVDGELFTEWRHADWLAPYFYPVIGPNGENITRHYPMKEGVEHESQDHPHHRSLRFSHSDVNGLNFWYWRPGRERELSTAEIKFEKIEKLVSGKTGEMIVWTRWLDGDTLVLREKMRIAITPLENQQLLMDYDVELHAPDDKPVVFGDIKDGGLYVRVAGTMKAAEHFKKGGAELDGVILNSRGNRNTDAWGKRAEWADFSGPDASGKTVGIAMFDHPDNLRFPTHWHARTYGLLAANRFGTDHFDPKFARPRGISCRPYGDDCPACNSRGGDYTLPAGESLTLRQRLYFHHGDSETAEVAKHYSEYSQPLAAQGEFAGEVTADSVLLQTRLTANAGLDTNGDIPGASGVACFEYATDAGFDSAKRTAWISAKANGDFIVRTKLAGLESGTTYFYRALIGRDQESFRTGPTRQFSTLPGSQANRDVRFCVGSCMIYERFIDGTSANKLPITTTDEDRHLGFPAFAAMNELKPDFFVGTGDIVYYDWPRTKDQPAATALPDLRKKWHEQFRFPRLVEFFGRTPAFWSKDDHDFRFDDADLTGAKLPAADTGIDLFREQLPIASAGDRDTPTYRTHRVSKHLQIWLTEGRDHRSPNQMPDGPDKSLWGKTQREWLQRTLRESDAKWKILISPTPMVGPDGARKRDSHANLGGFQHEANAFFAWLKENDIGGFFTVCGDRHWQFHSIHPLGVEEFGCGALNDENSILGHAPGDPRSTDPDARIKQPFKYAEPTGGFLHLLSRNDGTLRIEFRDDTGEVLHAVEKSE